MYKFFVVVLALAFAACNSGSSDNPSGKINVLCTTGIIANAFDSILDTTQFSIQSLMGPGTDPHLYKPSPNDINALKNADVIIANGLHLEGKINDILVQLQSTKKVLFISDGVPQNQLIQVAENVYDPHIWFDPDLWSYGVGAATDSCMKWFDVNKNRLSKQKLNWQLQVIELSYELEKSFGQVPYESRFLVTAHDAFSYYARRYGLQLRALQGISTQSEFGLKDLNDLATFVSENNIPQVFFESSVPKKSIQALQSACKAQGHSILVSGPLYSDALSAKDGEAGNYFDLLRYNSRKVLEGMP